MASTKPNVRNVYIVATIAIVILFFANYFFAYIPNKTDKMINQGIRVMQRMGNNIHEKEVHYNNTISSYRCDYALERIMANEDTAAIIDALLYSDCFWEVQRLREELSLFDEQLEAIYDAYTKNPEKYNYDFIIGKQDSLFMHYDFIKRIKSYIRSDPNVQQYDEIDYDKLIYWQVDTLVDGYRNFEYDRYDREKYVYQGITAEDFLKGVKRFEFFDDIFIVDPWTGVVLDNSKNDIVYFDHNKINRSEHSSGDSILIREKELKNTTDSTRKYQDEYIEYEVKYGIENEGEPARNISFSGIAIGEKEISHNSYYVYTHIVEVQGRQYLLTGLKSKSEFRSEVRAVSLWTVMISVILLLILVQILPVIKPFLLSKQESLNGTDLIWAAISVVFGVSAMALFGLGIDTFIVEEMHLVDKKLEKYSQSIEDNFHSETNKALMALKFMEKGMLTNNFKEDTVVSQALNDLLYSSDMSLSFLDINPSGKTDKYFTLDSSLTKISKQQLDLKRREYFQAHYGELLKSIWKIPEDFKDLDSSYFKKLNVEHSREDSLTAVVGETDSSASRGSNSGSIAPIKTEIADSVWYANSFKSYFVESIFSMANGKYQTTVSVKNRANNVLALVLPFQSVNNLYLQPKYSFCIIDKAGEIQFHTNQNKIKNENFFDEVNNDPDVVAFVKNDADTSLDINFAQKDYRAHISGIPNTDWNIITLYEVKNSRLIITSTFSVVFQFVLATLIYLLLLHILLKITTKRNDLTKHRFTYNFLNPLLRPHQYYWELLAVNIGIVLSLVVLYKSNALNLALNITIYFATLTAGILYNYLVLAGNEKQDGDNRPGWVESKWFVRILFGLTIIWLVFFGFSISEMADLDAKLHNLIFGLPVVALLIMSLVEQRNERKKQMLDDYNEQHILPFYLHKLSWVVVLAIIPTLLFFKPVYNYQHIWRTAANLSTEVDARIQSQKWDSNRINLFEAAEKEEVQLSKLSERLIEGLTFYFDNEGSELNGLNKSKNVSKNTEVNRVVVREGMDKYNPFFEVTYNSGKPYLSEKQLKPATIIAFSLPRVWYSDLKGHAWIFWIVVSVVLVVLYFIVTKITQKFFYIDLTRTLRGMLLQQKADTYTELFNDIKNREILLVGIPHSGRNAIALDLVKADKKSPLLLDFMEGKTSIEQRMQSVDLGLPVIINNLDYSIDDIEYSKFKLGIIEKIQAYRGEHKITTRFILISGKDTYQLLDIYDDKIKSLKKANSENSEERIIEKKILIDRWESALYTFSKHIVPIKLTEDTELVAREIGYNPVLTRYKERLEKIKADLDSHAKYLTEEEKDLKIIASLLDLAENYYFAIWNSCSRDEKFLLIDLANDGVLNSTNTKAIYSLVRKGILVVRPKLEIFNHSFRLFILESVGEEEIMSIEKEARKQGNWKSYQYMVIFLVIVVVIFLSLAEEKAVAQITSLVSLGAVLFPKIVQIFTAFASRKSGG